MTHIHASGSLRFSGRFAGAGLLLALGCLLLPPSSRAQGIECKKPSNAVERTICGDPSLLELDASLAGAPSERACRDARPGNRADVRSAPLAFRPGQAVQQEEPRSGGGDVELPGRRLWRAHLGAERHGEGHGIPRGYRQLHAHRRSLSRHRGAPSPGYAACGACRPGLGHQPGRPAGRNERLHLRPHRSGRARNSRRSPVPTS